MGKNTSEYFFNPYFITFGQSKKTLAGESIRVQDIPNLHGALGKGLRGESLSSRKNRHFIPAVKKLGITQIIDLRTADHSEKFKNTVEKDGLGYSHFPIDANATSTREIINYLPSLIKQIDEGNFYIACAQGLHRTDIALSMYYLFNPRAEKPPVLYGYKRSDGLHIDAIMQRANSIFRELTEDDRKKLGLENFDEKAFKKKKQTLIQSNN